MLAAGLGLEEPDIATIALRPGVVDTEMQTQIRGGGEAMDPTMLLKFQNMKNDGKLLRPELPAASIGNFAMHPKHSLSGKFISWDAPELRL